MLLLLDLIAWFFLWITFGRACLPYPAYNVTHYIDHCTCRFAAHGTRCCMYMYVDFFVVDFGFAD